MRARLLSTILLLPSACSEVGPFYCDEDQQCRNGDSQGACTLFGHCAFEDAACRLELRYDDSAGELAGVCVGDEEDFDAPGDCEPGPEFCGDGVDSDCFEDQDPSCPQGDAPETAIDITRSDSAYVNVGFAGNEYTPSCASPGGRDAFFQFTLDREELVYLDTWETDFHAVLVLREGACAEQGDFSSPELACVEYGCSESLSQWSGPLPAGTYCVVVDQYDEEVAAFGGSDLVVNLRHGPLAAPLDDEELEGDTCPAGDGADVWQPGCGGEAGFDSSYFFTLCEESIALTASTCFEPEFESVVYALDAYGDELACADGCTGGAGLAAEVSGPGLFYLVVDGDGIEQCGSFVLSADFGE